jgi:hypothetical protein
VFLQRYAIAVPKPVALQDLDLLCVATAASTMPRLTMVQVVPRRTNLDAPANATEHKAIRDKATNHGLAFYPLIPCRARYGKSILPGWQILSATLGRFPGRPETR